MKTQLARQQMVEQQVRAWDVLDASVLQVLKDLSREQFVPPELHSMAFADTELPIGHGESMMTPTVEGRVLQILALQKSDTVLEIGTGTGFLTACIARLSGSVSSIDIHDEFIQTAGGNLQDAGINNVDLAAMDATSQLPEGQFDVIVVTGSVETFDPRFVRSLKSGGRLFVVVGKPPVMDAQLVTLRGDTDWQATTVFETRLKPLVNGSKPPVFSF
jgi:protein-L-isoaspartate(D-aspartate) O-methyltransferase